MSLVIPSLTPGGAENVLALLANAWAEEGREVSVVTLGAASASDRRLHPAITRIALDMVHVSANVLQALDSNWKRVRRLRAELRGLRPHTVISFLPSMNVLTLASTRTLDARVVVAERIDPREEPIPKFWACTRRLLYPHADAVVLQTPDAKRWATRFLQAERVHVIPNPVAYAPVPADASSPRPAPVWLGAPGHKVFGVGRLTPQKGFDTLLRAYARCRPHHPDWSLIILGDGAERTRLEALAVDLGIQTAVTFPGHIPDVPSILRGGDLFVLSSRYEGFPNALLDAMTCGLAVISTDCPSGPRHIVRHGIDGLLVERDNVEALAAAMRQLMAAADLRQRLASRAVEVRERFSLPSVMRQWNALLEQCAEGA